MLRSERMGCYQVIVSRELAWEMINMLGELGDDMVEFIDSNKDQNSANRLFSRFIKKCEEIQTNLAKIKQLLKDYNFHIQHCEDVEEFLIQLREFLSTRDRIEKTYIDDINQEIESFTKQIFRNAAQVEELEKKYQDLKEQSSTYLFYKDRFISSLYYQHREDLERKKKQKLQSQIQNVEEIEQETVVVLSSKPVSRRQQPIQQKHRNEEDADWEDQFLTRQFTTVIGTVKTEDIYRFIRSIYRLTKGNFWNIQKVHAEFPDRTIFILFFPVASIQNSYLIGKINKILDVFNAKIFKSIINKDEIDLKILQIEQDKTDVLRVINLAKKQLYSDLEEWSLPRKGLNCSKIVEMQLFVEKERSIFVQLNNLKPRKHVFIGRLWCPKVYQEQLLQTQVKLSLKYPNQGQSQIIECEINDDDVPPTLFKLNSFTAPFQQIVNTYGIPRYKEINPGIYCIVMFSLQFGIMFGDIGHGGFLFLFGLYLCINHKKNPFDTRRDLNVLYSVRYVVLLLGFFALYSGLIYNDFFSLPIYLFHKSCYVNQRDENGELEYVKKPNCTYPFGFDPKWYIAQNELTFFNSFKMKLAVIIGVIQMTFGIILKGFNNKYFGQWIDFFFEFIPQLVFMVTTFGYMIFMIVIKWNINYQQDTSQAPSIINLMINLPLKLGMIPDGKSLWNQENQEYLQQNLLYISVCMVPLMLFPKPFLLYLKNRKNNKRTYVVKKGSLNEKLIPQLQKNQNSDDDFIQELRKSQIEKEETIKKQFLKENSIQESMDFDQFESITKDKHEFDFSEVFVHQVIETIEFVLGSISSTASYLRLWALSLAHSQLSKVFFEKTIGSGIIEGNSLQILIGWFVFVHITVFVLMSMDLMECFLHAIRLQWVEFQGKFYKADGVWFNSFSFLGNLRQFNVDLSNGIK
ncbi:V-ATPase A subunit 9-2 isotype of the V0 sector (macronuclear) [Tetrahymena thermophila SB210]|uniref:V-type proton ATPase subunit a n=1 Tax=Tetrahymena thermophila (strain SB210) TaxID=312017 RepID=Q22CW5_TETTS|nr:V-ATPase A subunit 9-2 isotype of the V0 sector [Tetrahymena thermophila SB210]EAR83154.2 V-ATPase A subunit 9-2 isotype of the V0 sector [Tetrahymena thermophila SB210]|eukprot:XP_001030817.2 V-ATPase A subunit 9-2 isotype of the V0 sector [Tetrahymena thermophila SB210]